jgi:hypothetical protein
LRAAIVDGRLQVVAAVSLLDNSRLIRWISAANEFVPIARETFEQSWQNDLDPVFGRLICWISFSAGAELLAKGLCLVHGLEIRKEELVPKYPTADIDEWISTFCKDWRGGETMLVTNFGSLGLLTHRKANIPSALSRLSALMKADKRERDMLFATYELLRMAIRNRDAHAYVPNVRDSHYNLVPQLFTACFNLLTSWLPGGPQTLNQWRENAARFNESV